MESHVRTSKLLGHCARACASPGFIESGAPLDRRRRAAPVRATALLLYLICTPALAALGLDLSQVDLQSPAYARFKQYVDTAVAGQPGYAFSPLDAVFMAELDGDPAYCALAVELVEDQVSEAETLIAGGQRPAVSYDSYLEVGDMIGSLAFTYDACAGIMTPTQRERWAAYAEQAVWNVWNHADASWGGNPFPWTGWSTSDPGNNYYYSFLEATMAWALASNSTAWRSFLETEKLPPLVALFSTLDGGGSPEGTGYGTAHMRLFWLYRFWRDATGQDLAAASSHLDDSILYWVHATVPTNDRFAPIGDQSRSSQPELFDYQRRLVLEARAVSLDPGRRAIAAGWLNRISVAQMSQGFNFRHDLLDAGSGDTLPATTFHHATGVGHLFARTDWTPDAWWLAFVAGPFEQSHAHEDQGSFTLFRRDWLTVSENIWSHSGIQQGGEAHNVLRFEQDGSILRQRRGTISDMSATIDGAGLRIEADLTAAYGNDAPITAWQRTVRLDGNGLDVQDHYVVDAGVVATFQLNLPVAPSVQGNRIVAGELEIEVLVPAAPAISVRHWPTVDADYLAGWRVDIAGGSGEYHVRLGSAGGIFRDGFESEAP